MFLYLLAIGFRYNGEIYIFTKNLQGDILSVVNAFSGETAASYVYDSWGKVISATGTLAEVNPIRYRGYYYDTETGLYYLQSRYYDPETGRFINADEFINTNLSEINIYLYCANCPVSFTDFCGHCRVRFDGFVLEDCHSFSCPYSSRIPQDELEIIIASSTKRPSFTPRKDPRKGSDSRQPTGDRERNKAHPDGEEHSRVPKGNNTGRKKFENSEVNDSSQNFFTGWRQMWTWRWGKIHEPVSPTDDLSFWEIINPFRRG